MLPESSHHPRRERALRGAGSGTRGSPGTAGPLPGRAAKGPDAEGLQTHTAASEDGKRISQYILGGNAGIFTFPPKERFNKPPLCLFTGGWDSIIWFLLEIPKYFQRQKLQPAKSARIQTAPGSGELFPCPQAVLSKLCFPRSAKTALGLTPAQASLPKSHFSSLRSVFLTGFVLWSSDNVFTALRSRPFSGRPDCIKNLSQRTKPSR